MEGCDSFFAFSSPNTCRSLIPLYVNRFQLLFPLFRGTASLQLESRKNLHLKGFNKIKALRDFSRETELN